MSDQIAALIREHIPVGGTYFDREERTTYWVCSCGAKCWLVGRMPDHAAHLAELIALVATPQITS